MATGRKLQQNKIRITWEQLKKIAPNVPKNADIYIKYLNDTMDREGINLTLNRSAMFLSEALHECNYFRTFKENLNYRPERLMAVWPTRFPSLAIAKKYAHNERALANYVYANRYGNLNEESDDGYQYRGRGIFMLTFKDNYKAAGKALKNNENFFLEDRADLVAEPEYAVATAGWFWTTKGLNRYADKDDIEGCTKVLNGGLNGIAERKLLYNKAKRVLS